MCNIFKRWGGKILSSSINHRIWDDLIQELQVYNFCIANEKIE